MLLARSSQLGTVLVFVCALGASNFCNARDLDTLKLILEERCVYCHDASTGDIEGDVDLAAVIREDSLLRAPHLLRDMFDVVHSGQMPPAEEGELDKAERDELVGALHDLLVEAVAQQPAPRTSMRRMTRFQYNNAIRDLFELKCEVYSLPERMMREHKNYFRPETGKMAETVYVGSRPLGKSQMIEPRLANVAPFPQDLRAEHGYDNQADHLSMSPLLMESFLKLGQSIVDSPDFNRQKVGLWPKLFVAPETTDFEQLRGEVRQRIELLTRRAFRGNVSEETTTRYTNFAMHLLEDGESFSTVMKSVAAAVISSPKFLYLFDANSDADEGYELATRLSFFLWASIPDDELLELAAAGKLGEPKTLAAQVDRMLRDQKLKGFCDSFPAQWLQLERIISSTPDREQFPGFYFSKYRTSMHMMLEPLLLFETVLIENHPLEQLIDPDFSYRSLHLSNAYGIQPQSNPDKKRRAGEVTLLTFDRVPIKTEEERRYGGVIHNAAVMTMTSGPQRTQPITRGAWLLTVIFNDPPKPPPADVPPLSEKTPGVEDMTLRDRLTAHRAREDCRSCHQQLDPLGFALENYDPIGRWREEYSNGLAIDASGTVFQKYDFTNGVEFKDVILQEKERFARGFVQHLMTFALARHLEPADTLAVEEILATASEDDYRMQALIREVVLSAPFSGHSRAQIQLSNH